MNKYFTAEEANRALALITPIVTDILLKMKRAEKLRNEVQAKKEKPNASESELMNELNSIEKLLNEIEYHMKELESVGVILKDIHLGLVDFPCIRAGRVVHLCWMFTEKTVSFWHETDHGFADRKLIDENFAETARV